MIASSRPFLPVLVRREHASLTVKLVAPPVALGLATLLNLGLYVLMGRDPVAVFHAMLLEPFLSWVSFSEVLLKTGPLLLIAQGLAIGFRAKVFNIGAEGQFILGAIFASAIPIWFPAATGQWIWPSMLVIGALGGALWASLTAFWRVRLNANEILVSLMLALVAAQLLNYLLLGPWKDPAGFNFPQSVMFQYDAMVPILIPGTRVNVSLLVAVAFSLAAWVFMQRSFAGYKLQVGGLAPHAAGYAGFNEGRAIWLSLLIGGFAAGLAGAAEVAGPLGQLQRSISTGYGYAAIIVAYLGGLHPVGIVFSALLMAALYIGGDNAMVSANLPVAAVRVFQGSLLLAYLVAIAFVRYRLVWRHAAHGSTS
ncbi:ABC transporter permease [Mesorhizobium sp. M4B.F.Ca.ET.215.01.1.1]|uniref:ABC transporter permease n=1 Tax=unclassified Mesorhizobium TaxID=325217 RepID=UPI000FCB4D0F|nr:MULTISPECIES: ABC transporter permease [unclassified Mesorhizobium]RUW23468.1 ABC transporter permease [Mesorhizobium sp. M4B.F.Ca.ET.013.02.1.1]RVD40816.1 ABC transporter permease [Mesorhizobium sp. M4B.F.Ca.ET.019.03.1.1]TGQ05341.1 ABC transporter permease [Mesorhizobium sp. M4B.F.Ca.ET.215.01.1.1]TGQ31345.1 ABC transporter permease [Mesorhizobium sp. M00.F.Ca.ET.220.01.1.1]TGQ98196.1 ABC transporter permease [Mesorhizobium sp. M4B.F.Ca.ET.203.01.1.1]